MRDDFSRTARKLLIVILITIGIAFLSFVLFYKIGKEVLDYYFTTSSYIFDAEMPYVEALQQFIDNNSISIDECEKLESWARKSGITYLTISKERTIIYGITYVNNFELAGNASSTLHEMWMYLLPVRFTDDTADAFVYADFTEKYYEILSIVSAIISILISLLIIYIMINKEMKLLQRKLKEAEEAETQIRESKNELVRSMAHDLRTPLTGLLTYAEITKLEAIAGRSNLEHIEKIISKANEIKELTNQIFDYSIMNSGKLHVLMDEQDTFKNVFEDYLSEFCQVLTSKGFHVIAEKIEWGECLVCVNINFIGRIFNNLISNICKYGKEKTDIFLSLSREKGMMCIEIKNEIETQKRELESTGLGLKNIEAMMQEMNGIFEYKDDGNFFEAKIKFRCMTS